MQKTSLTANALLWFGAAVSVAEILTGTYIAPLGFAKGLAAIITGHLIGCFFMYLAALIGAGSNKTAMETVRLSFGQKGALFFSSVNVLQLVGWTAVMLAGGAAMSGVLLKFEGAYALSVIIIAALILLCCLCGLQRLGKINIFAVGLLFVLTIILSAVIFGGKGAAQMPAGGIGFGAAVELSAAMPLSWLPVIADYIKDVQHPRRAALASTGAYFLGGCWMYIIGMGAALYAGESDIAVILLKAGLGFAAVLIAVFSTATTAFLDVYSAAASARSVSVRLPFKTTAAAVCVIAVLLALFAPVSSYEGFLYFIGSVFAPMIAVMISDFFVLKQNSLSQAVNWSNFIIWLAGFIIYRLFMQADLPLGNTLPAMACTFLLSLSYHFLRRKAAENAKL